MNPSSWAFVALVVQTDPDPFQLVQDFLNSGVLGIAFRVLLVFFGVLDLALIYWTFADSRRRGALWWYWTLVAIIAPFVGPLVYLIVRPPEYSADARERELELAILERELRQVNLCPNCRSLVEKDYLLCPECGWELKKPCENCEKPLHLNWSTCPYCATRQKGSRKIDWQD